MTQEILLLINDALRVMDEIENDIFINHRAKYAYSKTILDNYREEIDEIRQELNQETSEENAIELKNEITNMLQSVLAAKESGTINSVTNVKTLDSTIDSMIKDLDNNAPETVLPTANIDVQAIENAIPSFETVQPISSTQIQTPNMMEQDKNISIPQTIEVLEGTEDVIPQVESVIIEEAPVNNAFAQVTPPPQIQTEIVQTVTPDIVIVDDQQDQMSTMAPAIEIPTVEPMIQVPNIEIPNTVPITDTAQETEA